MNRYVFNRYFTRITKKLSNFLNTVKRYVDDPVDIKEIEFEFKVLQADLEKELTIFKAVSSFDVGIEMEITNGFKPEYATEFSAGADIRSAVNISIDPGKTIVVPAGFKMALPPYLQAEIRSRSGLSTKGIVVANSPGTIDADYRDEVKVILKNDGDTTFEIKMGDRIAQMVIMPYIKGIFLDKIILSNTNRKGGLGSTGIK